MEHQDLPEPLASNPPAPATEKRPYQPPSVEAVELSKEAAESLT